MPYTPTADSFTAVLHTEIWKLQILTMDNHGYQALHQLGLGTGTTAWSPLPTNSFPPVPVPFSFLVLTSGALVCAVRWRYHQG